MTSHLSNAIIVVSGLPRSGTSMMMKMLEAGGVPIVTDHERTPDDDNPEGYYELERVKQMPKGDTAWVPDARQKAVKVISALLKHLPAGEEYRVLFMRRAYPEILASQRKMLIARNRPVDQVDDAEMTRLFEKHLQDVDSWLEAQPNIRVLQVGYNAMLRDPVPLVAEVSAFLDGALDESAMLQAINPTLYRNRGS
ncbi:MAG: sulfotransferase domain-containing protein [Chloroflexota bacterium]